MNCVFPWAILEYQTDCLLLNGVNITLNNKEKKIRLLHIVDNLDRGGVQTWLMLLVKGLAELGFEQRVYCLNETVKPILSITWKPTGPM
jgi:hypothetical protein